MLRIIFINDKILVELEDFMDHEEIDHFIKQEKKGRKAIL